MAAGWCYELSPGWLLARKQFFMATDAVRLHAAYKRAVKYGWKPGDDVPEFAALSMEKQSDSVGELKAFGTSARGHILEPYAVRELNRIFKSKKSENCHIEHWDDGIIYRDDFGFSPDAMPPIPKVFDEENPYKLNADDLRLSEQPEFIVEIKSYEPWKHGKTISIGKYENEKIQIAMAFKVFEKMTHAYLFMYCPAANSYKLLKFSRATLEPEIKMIDGMLYMWRSIHPVNLFSGNNGLLYSEDEIYQDWLKNQMSMFNLR